MGCQGATAVCCSLLRSVRTLHSARTRNGPGTDTRVTQWTQPNTGDRSMERGRLARFDVLSRNLRARRPRSILLTNVEPQFDFRVSKLVPSFYHGGMSVAFQPTQAVLEPPQVASDLESIREKVLNGTRLSREDGLALFATQDIVGLGALAEWAAANKHGRKVYYVINGHINYSNFCTLSCAFCSFYRRKGKDRRSGGYQMTLDEALHQADNLPASGATEIHIVRRLPPAFPFTYYPPLLHGLRPPPP